MLDNLQQRSIFSDIGLRELAGGSGDVVRIESIRELLRFGPAH